MFYYKRWHFAAVIMYIELGEGVTLNKSEGKEKYWVIS